MSSLERVLSENAQNKCFRSLFGAPETLTDTWGLCYDHLKPSTFPACFLWTFILLNHYDAEEENSSVSGSDEAML